MRLSYSDPMNSAHRLLALVHSFAKHHTDVSMLSALTQIFNIQGETALEEATAVLQAALYEVRAWEGQLRKLGVPHELYVDAANQLRSAFNPTTAAASISQNLHKVWAEGPQHTLKWSGWVLREFDEQDIDDEDLHALQNAIEALEGELSNPKITSSVRRAIERQVSGLRSALRLYAIAGVQPLREAARNAIGELVTIDPAQREQPDSKSAVQRAAEVIKTAVDICDKAGSVMDAGEKLYALGKTLGPLLGYTST